MNGYHTLIICGGLVLICALLSYFDKKYKSSASYQIHKEKRELDMEKNYKLEQQVYLRIMDNEVDVADEAFKRILIQQNREMIEHLKMVENAVQRTHNSMIVVMIILFGVLMFFIYKLPEIRLEKYMEEFQRYLNSSSMNSGY